MKYEVKNAFYLNGDLVAAGDVVELTEKEITYFQPKDVLGDPVKPSKGKEPSKEPDKIEGKPPSGGDA